MTEKYAAGAASSSRLVEGFRSVRMPPGSLCWSCDRPFSPFDLRRTDEERVDSARITVEIVCQACRVTGLSFELDVDFPDPPDDDEDDDSDVKEGGSNAAA
jgi:hypothetical protein